MKTFATSLILACANLVLIGLLLLGQGLHLSAFLAAMIPLVVIPFLVLATVGFAIRDLVRPGSRWQAVLALILSIPIGVWYSLTSF